MKCFLVASLALAIGSALAQDVEAPPTVVITNWITPTSQSPIAEATDCGTDVICPTNRITEYIDIYNSTTTTTSIRVIPTLKVINQTYVHVNVIVKESHTSTFGNCLTNETVRREAIKTETLELNYTSTKYAFVPVTTTTEVTSIYYVNTTANCVKPGTSLGIGPGIISSTVVPQPAAETTADVEPEEDESHEEL